MFWKKRKNEPKKSESTSEKFVPTAMQMKELSEEYRKRVTHSYFEEVIKRITIRAFGGWKSIILEDNFFGKVKIDSPDEDIKIQWVDANVDFDLLKKLLFDKGYHYSSNSNKISYITWST